MGVSISSPPRATAGIRFSTGLELGPLFGLNAVRTFGARAVGAAGGCARPSKARAIGARALGAAWLPDGRNMRRRAVRRTIPAWRASTERAGLRPGYRGAERQDMVSLFRHDPARLVHRDRRSSRVAHCPARAGLFFRPWAALSAHRVHISVLGWPRLPARRHGAVRAFCYHICYH